MTPIRHSFVRRTSGLLAAMAAILPAAVMGRLKPCPSSPNCVSSLSTNQTHRVEPISFVQNPSAAWATLTNVVRRMERTTLIEVRDDYLHAEVRTAVFRFVDDLELALNRQDQRIDVRSASRIGYSDLGLNRRRVEKLRRRYAEAMKPTQRAELEPYRWDHRLLLLFDGATGGNDLAELRAALSERRAEVEDRHLLIFEYRRRPQLADDLGLHQSEDVVVLVGKDGGVKLRQQAPFDLDAVFAAIDAMPMRQDELR